MQALSRGPASTRVLVLPCGTRGPVTNGEQGVVKVALENGLRAVPTRPPHFPANRRFSIETVDRKAVTVVRSAIG